MSQETRASRYDPVPTILSQRSAATSATERDESVSHVLLHYLTDLFRCVYTSGKIEVENLFLRSLLVSAECIPGFKWSFGTKCYSEQMQVIFKADNKYQIKKAVFAVAIRVW